MCFLTVLASLSRHISLMHMDFLSPCRGFGWLMYRDNSSSDSVISGREIGSPWCVRCDCVVSDTCSLNCRNPTDVDLNWHLTGISLYFYSPDNKWAATSAPFLLDWTFYLIGMHVCVCVLLYNPCWKWYVSKRLDVAAGTRNSLFINRNEKHETSSHSLVANTIYINKNRLWVKKNWCNTYLYGSTDLIR